MVITCAARQLPPHTTATRTSAASASGGKCGAGIGGGVDGKGEGITVSGNAQLKVRGGSVHGDYGTGAGIGGGGSYGGGGASGNW